MTDDRMIFYMHLPKTAGTTIQNLVMRQYKKEDILYFYNQESILKGFDSDALKAVMGHFRYGFHKYTSKPFTYVTFMRDPIDQAVSHYYHYYDNKSIKKVQQMTIEEFAESKYNYNFQTRFISGENRIKEDPEKYLEIAKQNISNDFTMIGLKERLDESTVLMKNLLGYKHTFYNSGNINFKRYKRPEISGEALEALNANTLMDQKLYAFAKERFENQISQIPDFEKQVKRHVVANKWFQKLDPYYIKYKKLIGKL